MKATEMDIEKLKNAFLRECDRIAEDCEAEGYPSRGSNYDLRVEQLMQNDYYAPLFERM